VLLSNAYIKILFRIVFLKLTHARTRTHCRGELIHDIALQNLNVIFAIDRAGLVGSDGATHAGCFDLSFLRCIPNLTIMAPSNGLELYQMLNTAFKMESPVCIRYPRGVANMAKYETQDT
jgi:1-deoxy-D-xylulose-5-phosphate synthase